MEDSRFAPTRRPSDDLRSSSSFPASASMHASRSPSYLPLPSSIPIRHSAPTAIQTGIRSSSFSAYSPIVSSSPLSSPLSNAGQARQSFQGTPAVHHHQQSFQPYNHPPQREDMLERALSRVQSLQADMELERSEHSSDIKRQESIQGELKSHITRCEDQIRAISEELQSKRMLISKLEAVIKNQMEEVTTLSGQVKASKTQQIESEKQSVEFKQLHQFLESVSQQLNSISAHVASSSSSPHSASSASSSVLSPSSSSSSSSISSLKESIQQKLEEFSQFASHLAETSKALKEKQLERHNSSAFLLPSSSSMLSVSPATSHASEAPKLWREKQLERRNSSVSLLAGSSAVSTPLVAPATPALLQPLSQTPSVTFAAVAHAHAASMDPLTQLQDSIEQLTSQLEESEKLRNDQYGDMEVLKSEYEVLQSKTRTLEAQAIHHNDLLQRMLEEAESTSAANSDLQAKLDLREKEIAKILSCLDKKQLKAVISILEIGGGENGHRSNSNSSTSKEQQPHR